MVYDRASLLRLNTKMFCMAIYYDCIEHAQVTSLKIEYFA